MSSFEDECKRKTPVDMKLNCLQIAYSNVFFQFTVLIANKTNSVTMLVNVFLEVQQVRSI